MTNQLEKRSHERYKTHQTISYRLASSPEYKKGTTRNLCKTGFLLMSDEAIPEGEALDLAIRVDDTPIHFKGRSIHTTQTDSGDFLSGVVVLKISTDGMAPFLSFIDSLKAPEQSPNSAMDNVVQRIASEHKIITQYVMVVQGILADAADGTGPLEIETVLDLMQKELSTHFYIEEKLLFKTGLIHLPTEFHGLITELTQEHTELDLELNRIIEAVQGLQPGEGLREKGINEKVEGYLENLKNHATRELTELFPILESNEKAIQKLTLAVGEIVNG
ncbi:hemerythrin domain-containing protein [Desulfoluna spongiiphila]|uniref:Hemerythrin-like domain-containing protein n=1 Tax=Desulfoluna spongiiphila TaxID=419481 RepID=A0A1G5EAB0_9BACT|nr:hemerythrin domain-containing protein [Desulfoluna spongiiphila]SCY23640.1 Hemerythrin-like domain-containing protein [Desulfoluna spongiiphila]